VDTGMKWLERLLPFARYHVEGESMAPAFRDGARLLVFRWAYGPRRGRRLPAAGDVILLHDPERPGHALLKRVAFDPEPRARMIYVLGDNAAASRDSRHFGEVPAASVIGRAWRTY